MPFHKLRVSGNYRSPCSLRCASQASRGEENYYGKNSMSCSVNNNYLSQCVKIAVHDSVEIMKKFGLYVVVC